MNCGIPQRLSHLGKYDLQLLVAIPQQLRSKEERKALESLFTSHAVVNTHLLENLVSRPASNWHLELLDVDGPCKSSFLHPLCVPTFMGHDKGIARLLAGLVEKLVPPPVNAVLGDGVVIGKNTDAKVSVFQPSARLQTTIGLSVKLDPVTNATDEISDVDKVKLAFVVCPVQGGVVQLESAVWWQPEGLDGGDVCSNHICRGKLVGKITLPLVSKPPKQSGV